MRQSHGLTRLALAALTGVVTIAGCNKGGKSGEKSIADTTSTPITPATTTPAAAPGGSSAGAGSIALADLAGKWTIRATPTAGPDTTPTVSTLTATGEAGGWKMTFANGLTVTVRVTSLADSVVYEMGPYQSVRRKGVQVTTHGVLRKQGDQLVGTLVAHYAGGGADSVVTLRTEGTKVAAKGK